MELEAELELGLAARLTNTTTRSLQQRIENAGGELLEDARGHLFIRAEDVRGLTQQMVGPVRGPRANFRGARDAARGVVEDCHPELAQQARDARQDTDEMRLPQPTPGYGPAGGFGLRRASRTHLRELLEEQAQDSLDGRVESGRQDFADRTRDSLLDRGRAATAAVEAEVESLDRELEQVLR